MAISKTEMMQILDVEDVSHRVQYGSQDLGLPYKRLIALVARKFSANSWLF